MSMKSGQGSQFGIIVGSGGGAQSGSVAAPLWSVTDAAAPSEQLHSLEHVNIELIG